MRPTHQLSLRLRAPRPRRSGDLPDLSLIAAPLLRHGNRRGNPNAAPRCGAKTRGGTRCLCPAMANGKCRMHGGASTGPRTQAGRARIAKARTKHGRYTKAARARRAAVRERAAQTQWMLDGSRALIRAIRRGRTPGAADLMHFAGSPFLPPALQRAAVGAGPIWRQSFMHREANGQGQPSAPRRAPRAAGAAKARAS